ncbi:hypothetical protein ACFWM7_01320 [Streptomyces sp. NPDC058375]|uniref:hypothetical protein n=1 Tax=Streptomyces sp. NPDC058375 TaxID=3346467 RepID=UPI0036529543
MSTSPGPLLQALDGLWEQLRSEHPDLPLVRMAVVPTPPPNKHLSDRWHRDGEVVTGLVVSADTMRDGADAVLEAILHEAAHVLNWIRGTPDTSRRGTYHNRDYLAAAEEVGLTWPIDRVANPNGRGYEPPLGDTARAAYAAHLDALTSAIPHVLPHLTVPTSSTRARTPNRLTLECGCPTPRKIQVARTTSELGPITCGVCKKDFTTP